MCPFVRRRRYNDRRSIGCPKGKKRLHSPSIKQPSCAARVMEASKFSSKIPPPISPFAKNASSPMSLSPVPSVCVNKSRGWVMSICL